MHDTLQHGALRQRRATDAHGYHCARHTVTQTLDRKNGANEDLEMSQQNTEKHSSKERQSDPRNDVNQTLASGTSRLTQNGIPESQRLERSTAAAETASKHNRRINPCNDGHAITQKTQHLLSAAHSHALTGGRWDP
jgi:hypothetical protein